MQCSGANSNLLVVSSAHNLYPPEQRLVESLDDL